MVDGELITKKLRALQILGDPGDNYTLDIQQGFEERMAAEAPDVEIVTKAAMQWEAGGNSNTMPTAI